MDLGPGGSFMHNASSLDRTIATHYERNVQETERLTANALGRLEWMRTWTN